MKFSKIMSLVAAISYCLPSIQAHSTTIPQATTTNDLRCKYDNIPNDGERAVNYRVNEITQLVINGDSDGLDTKLNSWSGNGTQPVCLFDDGRPWISAIRLGYQNVFKRSTNWNQSLDHIKKMQEKRPNSAATALLESQYWINYAWNARGSGLAGTVTDDGQKLFIERLEKAEKVLLKSKSYASENPFWYDRMILVQSALSRPPIDRDKTFLEGVGKNKTYYSTSFTMLYYLLPKWGGSWGTVENLVTWSVDDTKATMGNSMYARMYWFAYSNMRDGEKLFGDTYASWPKMKKGFEDLMQRYPKSNWNLNNFAKFACLANDKKTFVSLRNQIGDRIYDEAWKEGVTLDLCDNKMGFASE